MKELEDLMDSWVSGEVTEFTPEILERHQNMLVNIKSLLESMVAQDQELLSEAQELLSRIEHGGGK